MRSPEYLSFSSFTQWRKDVTEFYLRYLSDCRPPYLPQAPAAAVGSGFDARVKGALVERLFGKGVRPQDEFEVLYEKQVEPQNRDDTLIPSKYAFERYCFTGFFDELLADLEKADGEPRFETRVDGKVGDCPIMGKPDLYWRRANGLRVVHDWKVNGFFGKSTTSPNKGYRMCRDTWDGDRQSTSHNKTHKLYTPLQFRDWDIDGNYMEYYNEGWAEQLSMYGWCLGEEVGDETFVIQIHQITAKNNEPGLPLLRVSEFRARVQRDFQKFLSQELQKCWGSIVSGHIFTDLSPEDNALQCRELDEMSKTLKPDDFFSELVRPKYKGY